MNVRWLCDTAQRLHRPGQRGTGALLRLLDDDGEVPGSFLERLIEGCIRSPRLPPLLRQYELIDAGGRLVCRFDFAIPAARLGIEAHSRKFHFGRLPEGADEDRDHAIARVGWQTLYLGYQATRDPERARSTVEQVVAHRLALISGSAGSGRV